MRDGVAKDGPGEGKGSSCSTIDIPNTTVLHFVEGGVDPRAAVLQSLPVAILCRSDGREDKDRAIRETQETQLLGDR